MLADVWYLVMGLLLGLLVCVCSEAACFGVYCLVVVLGFGVFCSVNSVVNSSITHSLLVSFVGVWIGLLGWFILVWCLIVAVGLLYLLVLIAC